MSDQGIRELTKEEAIEFAESGAWKCMSHAERAALQLSQRRLCMPFQAFHESIEDALGRPVYTHEFGLNWSGLKKELEGRSDAPTMDQIVAMIPPCKGVIIVSGVESE